MCFGRRDTNLLPNYSLRAPGWVGRQRQSPGPLWRGDGAQLLAPQPSCEAAVDLGWRGGKNDFDVKNGCIGYCLKCKVSALVMLIH